PGSRPGSPRADPAVAVGSSLGVPVGWVYTWAWSFPLRRECRKTTIISGRVGEEKPRSKAPILSDRSRPQKQPITLGRSRQRPSSTRSLIYIFNHAQV